MNEDVKPAGRPRDDAAGPALKKAARKLVREHGYGAVSIGQIIAAAGVSRQTLYRRWDSKADLVLEAFFESAGSPPDPAPGAPIRPALEAFLLQIFRHLEQDGGAIRNLIASAQTDPAFLTGFRENFVIPRERMVTDLLDRAVAERQLPPGFDIATATQMLHGGFWYRMLNGQPLDEAFARAMVAAIWPPETAGSGR
ncbi:TetR/AcrR family transcriptional regulator [Halovulum sp. GXIMD14794]